MEFIDLKKQQTNIRSEIDFSIKKVLDHGKYILGPEVFELEKTLAEYVGVNHCITVSSGTDALLISMMALGIKSGDEIITTPFTFIAAVEAIKLLGAKPVYVDIDDNSYNISSEKIESSITEKTKLILPVSLFGQCADMDPINRISKKYNLPVLEDGAQSFGATYKGRKSCSMSTIGCTSFFPSKPLGCYGDGGAIFTNDDELASKMRSIRVHGQTARYHHSYLGLNGRLDTIQAAILLIKFKIFNNEILLRNEVADFYTKELNRTNLGIETPSITNGNVSVYAQYAILVNNREELISVLKKNKIPTVIHYPIPAHMQNEYRDKKLKLPVSEYVAEKILCIPMHPYLQKNEQDLIIKSIVNAL
jgi:UDP-2-acetamido-2-deoxy-ribo-hexuluronate aminotransferase